MLCVETNSHATSQGRSPRSFGTEDSFLCPKLSVTDSYPQDGESNQHLPSSFLNIHFNIILLPQDVLINYYIVNICSICFPFSLL